MLDHEDESAPEFANLFEFALRILELPMRHGLQFRVGINHGEVIAGVIGHNKMIFDLWGDAGGAHGNHRSARSCLPVPECCSGCHTGYALSGCQTRAHPHQRKGVDSDFLFGVEKSGENTKKSVVAR